MSRLTRMHSRAALGLLLAVSACAPRARTAPSPAPASPTPAPVPAPAPQQAAAHDMTTHGAAHDMSAMGLPATAGPGYTVADVRFMQHMIGHHAQAIIMAAQAPTHGASENVRKLAQKIDISQRDEIVMMKSWLKDRNQAIPSDSLALAMTMPGMLTDAQMAELAAARGIEFDRLFLSRMIQHHQGALLMVEELFDSPGAGQDSEIFRFASDVDADQRDEIYVMQQLLDMIR